MYKRYAKITAPKIAVPRLLKTAAYARVSCAKDAMFNSLAMQVSYYSRKIQETPGWVYCGVYADEAYTGTSENRPEFQRLLADCRAGKIDLVLVKSISRFARNTMTLLQRVRELKDLGVDIYFENENIHTMSDEGELMLSLIAAVAQEQSRSVSDNCKWRIRKQFADGELATLRFLYGYRWDGEQFVIDPIEAAVVEFIFQSYNDGVGATDIARQLRGGDIPTMRGGEWTPKRVRMILQNEKYAGAAMLQKYFILDHLTKRKVVNRGELPKYYFEDVMPQIVDMAIFEDAQERLAANGAKSKAGETTNGKYPFTSLVRCGHCGKNYTRKRNHDRYIWHCSSYMMFGKEACCAKAVPEDVLYALTTKALGLSKFDKAAFRDKISDIWILEDNRVAFLFKDGTDVEHTWLLPSRRDSWDEAARQRARECAHRRQYA